MPAEPNITDTVAQALAEAAAPYAVNIAVDALTKASDRTEDKTASAILAVIASYVQANGTEHVEALGNEIAAVIRGKKDVQTLDQRLNAGQLSMLVEGLQAAEAGRRRQYAHAAEGFGVMVAQIGQIVVAQAARAVMRDLK